MRNARILIMIVTLGFGGAGTTWLFAVQKSGERGTPDVPKGNLQRSAEILYFKRFAESGSERGKEIYFYKCWVCHNDYTRSAGTTAPTLRDLYKKSEEHTSELQSHSDIVCRLLLEKKKQIYMKS